MELHTVIIYPFPFFFGGKSYGVVVIYSVIVQYSLLKNMIEENLHHQFVLACYLSRSPRF